MPPISGILKIGPALARAAYVTTDKFFMAIPEPVIAAGSPFILLKSL
jgi:hypothetical protein